MTMDKETIEKYFGKTLPGTKEQVVYVGKNRYIFRYDKEGNLTEGCECFALPKFTFGNDDIDWAVRERIYGTEKPGGLPCTIHEGLNMTPFSIKEMKKEMAKEIKKIVKEKGIRQTSRLSGIARTMISRVLTVPDKIGYETMIQYYKKISVIDKKKAS